MEGQTGSGSRRTRFTDDTQLDIFPDDNSTGIFYGVTNGPVFAVLHDAVPDLGNRPKESVAPIDEPLPTLANLTAEFNDLSRKMTLLKDTIKANQIASTTKKVEPMKSNSLLQTLQVCDITGVATAKQVVRDCIAELISINHFLDGNEEIAAVYREKLRRAIANEHGKVEAVDIQGVYLAANSYDPEPRGKKFTADSAIGASDHFFSRHRKEAEIQTEAERAEIIVVSSDKRVNEFVDANVTSRPTGEASQQSKRAAQKKNRKWYSGCACCTRKKKSNKNIEAAPLENSSSRKNRTVKGRKRKSYTQSCSMPEAM